jgi:predicted phosphodiesterase
VSAYSRGKEPTCGTCGVNIMRQRGSKQCTRCAQTPGWHLDDPDHPVLPRGYESQWLEWQKFIGQARDRYAGPSKRPVQIGRQKIVVAGDFHAPFHHKAFVASMFERERDADLLIVAGDLQDHYSVSRFTKYEHVSFEEEMAAVTLLLQEMSERFPRVIVVEGNHDRPRFEKQLRERLSEEMVKVVEYLAGGNLSAVAAAARRFPNVEIAKHKVGTHNVGWFTQVNDLIVSHAEKYSVTPGAATRKIEEWFADQHDVLGLQPWRVLVQAHTHQFSFVPWHSDKLLLESGCLCVTHGYTLQPRIGGRPQRRGYITLEQVDGRTDVNAVRIVWLDHDSSDLHEMSRTA